MAQPINLLHVEATLTSQDAKQHIRHIMDVPEGITRLVIRLTYTPRLVEGQEGNNLLSLTLFDLDGFRGAGHNRLENVIDLSAVYATPGYFVGDIQAGKWTVYIDAHMILPTADLHYTLSAEAYTEEPVGALPVATPKHLSSRGAGWYRGDLHAHTIHSDGYWDVPDLVASALERGLDFVTLTDHNTHAPLAEMDSFSDENLLTMGGMELTTYYGHALALGVREWIDWRISPTRSMTDITLEVEFAGGLFIIAHPLSVGDPICTGCDWQYNEVMPGVARLVEIWNSGLWANPYDQNEQALTLWFSWLNQGFRMVATAGTDNHGYPAHQELARTAEIGFNVIYAEALTESAILEALRQGHSYVSGAPTLTFTAHNAEGQSVMMGDEITGTDIHFAASWSTCAVADELQVISNGQIVQRMAANTAGTYQWSTQYTGWTVIAVRATDGNLRAVTNPIYHP